MQLVPENGDGMVRFSVAAAIIASLPPVPPGAPAIPDTKWSSWINELPLRVASLASQEDATTGPLTEAFTFFGGSFMVFPGFFEESTFILRHLCDGIFLPPTEFRPSDFHSDARSLISGVLLLSDEVARRSSLTRNVPYKPSAENMVVVSRDCCEHFAQAVTFSQAEVDMLLDRAGVPAATLAPLVLEQGELDLERVDPFSPPTPAKPILRSGGQFVVLAPIALLGALRHAIIRLAAKYNLVDQLSWAFRTQVFLNATQSIQRMGMTLLAERVPKATSLPTHQALVKFDTDKILHVLLLSDDLKDYDPDGIEGEWRVSSVFPDALREAHGVERHLLTDHPAGANKVLHLIVVQGIGRRYAFGLDAEEDELLTTPLVLSGADLETVSLVESRNSLILGQYARARTRARRHTRIICMSQLDEFEFYRSHHCGYYFTDDPAPDAVSIMPGGDSGF